jgi:RNA polymerase sigma-70 factor (ECF subfamily)
LIPEPSTAGERPLRVRSIDADTADARRASQGDADAFGRLYARHSARIQTLSRRFLGPADASDGTQEVFLRAWTRVGQFRAEAAFGTWLHRLAVNVLLRHSQRMGRHRRTENEIGPELPSPGADGPKLPGRVDLALATLAIGLREVVVLHDMESYTHNEIAEVLGISVSASKMRLHRARMALRAALEGRTDE